MTPDDPRHPHLSAGYFAHSKPGDMAARPQSIDAPTHSMTSTSGDGTVTVVHDSTMLPGEAYEEMGMAQLRKIASKRGVSARGLRKPALIAKLRA